MLELLSPAGSMEALYAAVQNGANAVYLGSGIFNARQGAKNFTIQTLAEAVKYCHIRGVAVHLTLNTLVSDREMEQVCTLIREASDCGVDAFIVQDLAVARLCSQIAPHIPLHGSTQMSIHSLSGVLFCAGLGMKRVVLSRELARDEILYITQNSPIEIEVFAHGALCMCYSGQCYLSAAIGGRSGNRGRCAQPCRQSYGYGRWENRHPLSLKDNCLLPHLAELERMGVASIKLEGRMKRPEYVATVTNVYRRVLDGEPVTRQMMSALSAAFNRQGFTDGYYTGNVGQNMFGIREDKYDDPKYLADARATYEARENPLVPITARMVVTEGETVLTVTDPQGRVCQVRGAGAEKARTLPLTEEVLRERLAKTGGTPYYCEDIDVDIDPGVTLSAASINALRREALNQLTALRGRREIPETGKAKRAYIYPGAKEAPVPVVQVTSKEQITDKLLKMKPAALYVPLHILAEDPIFCHELNRRVRVAAVLPRIVTDLELDGIKRDLRAVYDMGVHDVLVGNLGLLLPARQMGFRIRGDYGLNIYNSQSVNILRELELISATLSFEMTMPQIRDVSKALPCEILVYGRMPLMVTENCLIKNRTGTCSCHLTPGKLVDRTGAEFPIIKDGNRCRSILLNGKKLSWLDRQKDLNKLGLWGIRMYFTTESAREVDTVLESYMNPGPFDPGACTRGLYLRGLE
ncbi:MAG: U32 family peptidase [Ruminococcaceae bacterium]|nr:U32 family peptidase [Oscillospiraceae bacterium]